MIKFPLPKGPNHELKLRTRAVFYRNDDAVAFYGEWCDSVIEVKEEIQQVFEECYGDTAYKYSTDLKFSHIKVEEAYVLVSN